MTLRLNDEERKITLRSLKARLEALRTEITQTDNPQFSLELGHEEKLIQALIGRIESLAGGRGEKQRKRNVARRSPTRRPAKSKRDRK